MESTARLGRPLPSQSNPLMTEEIPPYETLVARRRLGQTDLAVKAGQIGTSNSTKPKNLGTFDYAHLRAPLPKGIVSGIFKPSPASYFLMRRSHDGYISATGMFKATFPYAEAIEEEVERKYIKSLNSTSPDETAGNVWISPEHALVLAKEYNILPWITALLDNTPIEVHQTKEQSPRNILSPPTFLLPVEALAPPSPTRRSRRSASPSKIASPKKAVGSTRARKTARGPSEEPLVRNSSKTLQKALKDAGADAKLSKPAGEAKEEPVVKVSVDTDVQVNGDVETTHTHVEVEIPAGLPELPLPEDTEAMIAKAKEMVEAATNGTNGTNGEIQTKTKRKADELEGADENQEAGQVTAPAKKVKIESELKKERVKTRALIGISATLAIGAIIPYVFNVF